MLAASRGWCWRGAGSRAAQHRAEMQGAEAGSSQAAQSWSGTAAAGFPRHPAFSSSLVWTLLLHGPAWGVHCRLGSETKCHHLHPLWHLLMRMHGILGSQLLLTSFPQRLCSWIFTSLNCSILRMLHKCLVNGVLLQGVNKMMGSVRRCPCSLWQAPVLPAGMFGLLRALSR